MTSLRSCGLTLSHFNVQPMQINFFIFDVSPSVRKASSEKTSSTRSDKVYDRLILCQHVLNKDHLIDWGNVEILKRDHISLGVVSQEF